MFEEQVCKMNKSKGYNDLFFGVHGLGKIQKIPGFLCTEHLERFEGLWQLAFTIHGWIFFLFLLFDTYNDRIFSNALYRLVLLPIELHVDHNDFCFMLQTLCQTNFE